MTPEQPPTEPSSTGANNPAAFGAPDPQAPQNPANPMYPAYPLQGAYPPGAPYPYPPDAGYAPYAGYPPAGSPAQPSGAYPQPSGAYAPAQPVGPAPDYTAAGAPNPPYPGYPAYPQPGAYPPDATYPGAPYSPNAYPAAPSYPLYSPYASAPYGAPAPGTYPAGPQLPPQPPAPNRGRRVMLPAILGGVAAVVIIAVIAVGLLALRGRPNDAGANATPTPTLTPAATTQPTATAFPGSAVYTSAIPGACGDHPQEWNTDTFGASVNCAGGVMTLTDPATDKYLAAEYFQPPNYAFPSQYAATVTVANLTNACGGILVLGSQAEGYAGYVCSSGSWGLYSYDSNGNSTTVDSGDYPVAQSDTLELALSPGKLDFSIDGVPISTTQPTITVSDFLALQVYPSTQGDSATADFTNFVVTA